MSKKLFIILVSISIVFIFGAGYTYFRLTQNEQMVPQPSTVTTPITSVVNPVGTNPPTALIQPVKVNTIDANLIVKTPKGDIPVINFYKNPQTTVFDKGGDATIIDDPRYAIDYNVADQSFVISILANDIRSARTVAESDFLKKLGITKDQACNLRIQVTVPLFVSDNASGIDYGLSWCPNGKPMPTNIGPGPEPV